MPESNCAYRRPFRWVLLGFILAVFLFSGAPTAPSPAEAYSSKTRIAKKKIHRKHHPRKKRKRRSAIRAKAIFCVDLGTRKTVVARNPNRRLPVASLTKLMTALVALEKLPLKKRVKVPRYIRRVPRSVVGLRPGDRVSVKDLLHGLLIGSGNDCAETLACAYPGGKRKFIRAMNRKARKVRASRTRVYTPSGLDRRIVIRRKGKRIVRIRSNVSTAVEMARIADKAFANKIIRSICLKKRYRIRSAKLKRGYRVRTTNKLLRGNLPLRGAKTGYTSRAGHCLASKFRPGKHSLLIVVLGSPNHFRDTKLVYDKAVKKLSRSHRRVDRKSPPRRTRRSARADYRS